ncbi:hypothetical protein [Acidovorax sp. NCPPB 3576]|uniref:hypothetical protein n=1 Tax=Acidovorax sp. NCPPB 3576 TaxID=2940488 RepID=UPI002349D7BF|nr:hypothetical protein [Acidovorax sp. NCPPB 3576]WCM86636.1 hypothetical protein M5C98_14745 [Acidovorax sp. NCPPB 3576]
MNKWFESNRAYQLTIGKSLPNHRFGRLFYFLNLCMGLASSTAKDSRLEQPFLAMGAPALSGIAPRPSRLRLGLPNKKCQSA